MSNHPRSAPPTRGRRGARRLAVQVVYQWLMAGGAPPVLISEFLRERASPGLDREYFRELASACLNERQSLEALLAPGLAGAADDLDPVEHAILLVGAAEMRDRPELSLSIIINEAVELAKVFGADNGHRFVNGVLDKVGEAARPGEYVRRRGGGGRG